LELALGALYMWGGAFVDPIEQLPGWDAGSAQWPFSIGVVAFAIMVIISGRYKEKVGTRNLVLLSAAVMGGGYILAGLLPVEPIFTVFAIGVIGGAGIGFAYALPISVGTKWFPDKKGLVVGLGMAGFGAGSLIWIYLAEPLLAIFNLQIVWIIYGLCFAGMIGFSWLFMYDPPEGYVVPGFEPPATVKTESGMDMLNFTDKEMLKTPQFYFIFLSFMIGAAAGLMVIGIAKVWPTDVLQAVAGLTEIQASNAATFAAGAVYPLFNGIGRIGYGSLSDKIGWKNSLLIMNSLQGTFMFLSLILVGNVYTLWFCMAILAANYGGNFSLFPTATDNIWGSKHLAANYGWVFFAYGIGGLLGPIIGGEMRKAGAQEVAIIISAISLFISVILIFITRQPEKK